MLKIDFLNEHLNSRFVGKSIAFSGVKDVEDYLHHCARHVLCAMRADQGAEGVLGLEKETDEMKVDSVLSGLSCVEMIVGCLYRETGRKTNPKDVQGKLSRFPLRVVDAVTGSALMVGSQSTFLNSSGKRIHVSMLDERLGEGI